MSSTYQMRALAVYTLAAGIDYLNYPFSITLRIVLGYNIQKYSSTVNILGY